MQQASSANPLPKNIGRDSNPDYDPPHPDRRHAVAATAANEPNRIHAPDAPKHPPSHRGRRFHQNPRLPIAGTVTLAARAHLGLLLPGTFAHGAAPGRRGLGRAHQPVGHDRMGVQAHAGGDAGRRQAGRFQLGRQLHRGR